MEQVAREIATAHDESIVTLLSRVVSDAEQVARAEIELQKTKLLARMEEARGAIVFLLVAIVTGSLASIALVVGVLMILAPRVGPIWATVIVVGVLLAAAALCGWLALRQFKLMLGSSRKLAESLK